ADTDGVGVASAQPPTARNPTQKSTAASQFDMVFPLGVSSTGSCGPTVAPQLATHSAGGGGPGIGEKGPTPRRGGAPPRPPRTPTHNPPPPAARPPAPPPRRPEHPPGAGHITPPATPTRQ